MHGAAKGGNESKMKIMLDVDWTSKEPRVEPAQWQGHLKSCLISAVKAGQINIAKIFFEYGVRADSYLVAKGEGARMG